MRTSQIKINSILKSRITTTFAQTLADFKSAKEVEMFLKDFLSDTEVETYSKRLAVAYWLKKGRSYANIKQNLKVSSATIASVQESLNRPGVKLALKKMEAEEWANVWADKIKRFVGK